MPCQRCLRLLRFSLECPAAAEMPYFLLLIVTPLFFMLLLRYADICLRAPLLPPSYTIRQRRFSLLLPRYAIAFFSASAMPTRAYAMIYDAQTRRQLILR